MIRGHRIPPSELQISDGLPTNSKYSALVRPRWNFGEAQLQGIADERLVAHLAARPARFQPEEVERVRLNADGDVRLVLPLRRLQGDLAIPARAGIKWPLHAEIVKPVFR
jgi:hypothetical protein